MKGRMECGTGSTSKNGQGFARRNGCAATGRKRGNEQARQGVELGVREICINDDMVCSQEEGYEMFVASMLTRYEHIRIGTSVKRSSDTFDKSC